MKTRTKTFSDIYLLGIPPPEKANNRHTHAMSIAADNKCIEAKSP